MALKKKLININATKNPSKIKTMITLRFLPECAFAKEYNIKVIKVRKLRNPLTKCGYLFYVKKIVYKDTYFTKFLIMEINQQQK